MTGENANGICRFPRTERTQSSSSSSLSRLSEVEENGGKGGEEESKIGVREIRGGRGDKAPQILLARILSSCKMREERKVEKDGTAPLILFCLPSDRRFVSAVSPRSPKGRYNPSLERAVPGNSFLFVFGGTSKNRLLSIEQ